MHTTNSIRPFIGAQDYSHSCAFYQAIGFEQLVLGDQMSLFKVNDQLSFYLQDYYVKDWVDNSMILLEVDDVEAWKKEVEGRDLKERFPKVRISDVKEEDWGQVFYIHDPSGILWHVVQFK